MTITAYPLNQRAFPCALAANHDNARWHRAGEQRGEVPELRAVAGAPSSDFLEHGSVFFTNRCKRLVHWRIRFIGHGDTAQARRQGVRCQCDSDQGICTRGTARTQMSEMMTASTIVDSDNTGIGASDTTCLCQSAADSLTLLDNLNETDSTDSEGRRGGGGPTRRCVFLFVNITPSPRDPALVRVMLRLRQSTSQ
jgi:hypothetical protein